MALFTNTNLWGAPSGLEAQRADLWILDLTPVYERIRRSAGLAIGTFNTSFDADTSLIHHPISVSLPAVKTRQTPIINGTISRTYPSYNEPVDSVRVDFRQSVALNNTSKPIYKLFNDQISTALYRLLMYWFLLGQAGQEGLTTTKILLQSAQWKPDFKVNLDLQLLRGSENTDELLQTTKHTLKNCWLRRIQQKEIAKNSSGEGHVLTVDLQPEEIIS